MQNLLYSELLPRRNSSQFQSLKKKKLDIIGKWITMEKKLYNLTNLNLEFSQKSIIRLPISKMKIAIPFSQKINQHELYLILSDKYRKMKKEVKKLFNLKSIGKISNYKNFIQKGKPLKNKIKGVLSKTVLIDKAIEQKIKKLFSQNIRKKNPFFIKINLKNKPVIEILKNLSIVTVSHHTTNSFFTKFSNDMCSKIFLMNVSNLIGGVFEKIPIGNINIAKISIKTLLLPKIFIYFKE